MNKKEYMEKLEVGLSSMSYKDVKEILSEIEEHFNVGFSNGKTEEEICKNLGSADDLAKAYLEGTDLPKALVKKMPAAQKIPVEDSSKTYDTAGVIFVIFFNLLVFIPVWLSVVTFLVAMLGVEAGLISGLVGVLLALPGMGTFLATGIVFALLMFFIIVFIAVLCYFAIKYFAIGTAKYVSWNVKVWKKGF